MPYDQITIQIYNINKKVDNSSLKYEEATMTFGTSLQTTLPSSLDFKDPQLVQIA